MELDPIETQLVQYVEYWKGQTRKWIVRCNRAKRIRSVFSWLPCSLSMLAYGMEMYRGRYGWAAFDLVEVVVLTCLNWWLWTRVLKCRRDIKKICAAAVVTFEKHLREHREYKERGFE